MWVLCYAHLPRGLEGADKSGGIVFPAKAKAKASYVAGFPVPLPLPLGPPVRLD